MAKKKVTKKRKSAPRVEREARKWLDKFYNAIIDARDYMESEQ